MRSERRSHRKVSWAVGSRAAFKERELKMVAAPSTLLGATHALAGAAGMPANARKLSAGPESASGGMAQWYRGAIESGVK